MTGVCRYVECSAGSAEEARDRLLELRQRLLFWEAERESSIGGGGGGGSSGGTEIHGGTTTTSHPGGASPHPGDDGDESTVEARENKNHDPDADYGAHNNDSDGSVELTGMDSRDETSVARGCMRVGSKKSRKNHVRVVVKPSSKSSTCSRGDAATADAVDGSRAGFAHGREHRASSTARGCAASSPSPDFMIDGYTLVHVFGDKELESLFAEVADLAGAIIVCRSSPRQKAAVVRAVKEHRKARVRAAFNDDDARRGGGGGGAAPGVGSWLRRASAWLNSGNRGKILAIGDGANDCAMITMADIGVGIKGREGRQAANSADYAVAQFSHLRRLLLLHGHLSQYRLSRLIRFSFYKNVQFAALLFFYQFMCGYSGQALYDSITAAAYNVLLTALPVLLFALLDQPLTAATLLAEPWLYSAAPKLTYGAFWKAVWDSAVAAAVNFYFTVLAITAVDRKGRAVNGLWMVGKTAFTATLITVTLEIALVSRHWTWPFAVSLVLSVAIWFPILEFVPEWFTYYEMVRPRGPGRGGGKESCTPDRD